MTKFSYKTPPPPTLMLVFETVLIRDRHTVRKNTNALTDTIGQNSAISFSLRHLGTPVDVVVNTLVGSVPVNTK